MAKKSGGRSLNFGEYGLALEERRANYEGDSYLVDALMESGYTLAAARAEVQDPEFLKSWLEYDGIKDILADRLACKGLLKAILEQRADVIDKLIDEVRWLKVGKKRGPRRRAGGKYNYEWVAELRQQRLSWGKIGIAIWGSSQKANLAKAHYNQARKKGLVVAR